MATNQITREEAENLANFAGINAEWFVSANGATWEVQQAAARRLHAEVK